MQNGVCKASWLQYCRKDQEQPKDPSVDSIYFLAVFVHWNTTTVELNYSQCSRKLYKTFDCSKKGNGVHLSKCICTCRHVLSIHRLSLKGQIRKCNNVFLQRGSECWGWGFFLSLYSILNHLNSYYTHVSFVPKI